MLRQSALVLVVDGESAARSTLTRVLEPAGYSTIEVESGEQALAIISDERPSLVILNVKLPGMSGYEVCKTLRDDFEHEVAIVFVSAERTEPYDRAAGLLVGADDYVAAPFAAEELLARIRRLVGREPGTTRVNGQDLTKREREVLRALAQGHSQADIAGELSISSKTVATHIQRILGKLRVHSRAQAVALAHKNRLVELPD
ncbi:MAG: response regulator transcription factor [Gaiellaceae bacterium]